jgi:archaeosine synthase beta-subunit
VTLAETDRRIRALRPPKPHVDAYRAHGWLVEEERRPPDRIERALTVFLAGAECPFTCSFCDLWRFTLDGRTPSGALVRQLDGVLDEVRDRPIERLKLYNASNFFDARAVPREDVPLIASRSQAFESVTVESHASTIGARTLDFADQIEGRLEVAIGLETIHPIAMAKLNKRLDQAQFDKAAAFLARHDIDLRVFVLLGAPFVPAAESIEWTVKTVDYAIERGAAIVSIIPVRGGNGELERLQSVGAFVPPTLRQLEEVLEHCPHDGSTSVTVDLWDAHLLAACECCGESRIERLRRLNVYGGNEAAIQCPACEADA